MTEYKQVIQSLIRSIGFERLAHSLVFLLIFVVFYLSFHGGFILFGDLATTFPVNNNLYLKEFSSAWSDNAFLGYNSLLYTVIRTPFYVLTDLVTLLLGPQNWWVFLFIMYGLRYYLFFVLLRFLGVRWLISVLIAIIYCFNFFFVDRLGHMLISFASVAVPGLIVGYLSSAQRLKVSSVILFIFSSWIVLSSMHVTLMTSYFFVFLLAWEARRAHNHGMLKQFIRNTLSLTLFTIGSLSILFIPVLYQFFFAEGGNLISQVGNQASEAIYAYSRTTLMPYPLVGLGFYASGFWQLPTIMFLALLFLLVTLYCVLNYRDARKGGVFYITLITFGALASISTLEPFINLLKQVLPGFNSIKDSSYFILFTILSLFTLLALSIEKSGKVGAGYIFLSIFAIFTVSANVFAFNGFRDFKTTKIPVEFNQLSEHLNKDKRTLVLPLGWVSRFSWSNDQIMSGFFTLLMSNHQVIGQNIIEGPSIATQQRLDKFYHCFQSNCPTLNNSFAELDIDQIVLFKGGKYEFQDILHDYTEPIQALALRGLLEETGDNQYFKTYKWKGVDDGRVRGAVSYERVTPAKYEVIVKVNGSTGLTLLTAFDPNWKIFPSSSRLTGDCSSSEGERCRSALSDLTGDIGKLFQKNYFDDSHVRALDYANSWEINSATIVDEFPRDAFHKGENGEVTVGITIYYRPQAAVLLGVAGSLVFVSFCAVIIVIKLIGRRKNASV